MTELFCWFIVDGLRGDDDMNKKELILVIIGVLVLSKGIDMLNDISIDAHASGSYPHYREIPYTLSDGTPCVIIRGGSHSGMVGVTGIHPRQLSQRQPSCCNRCFTGNETCDGL